MNMQGKVAIVTGASRGIGAGISKRFAAEGASMLLVARTATTGGPLAGSLEEVATAIRERGGTCATLSCNLADPVDRARIVPAALEAFGRIDIVVNNAAWSRFVPIWEAEPKHVQLAFQMNLVAPQEIAQQALPHLRDSSEGWILNISSATANMPPPAPYDTSTRYYDFNHNTHPTLYGTSKAALDRLTAGWAIELNGSGIAANILAPVGAVASEGALAVGGWDERDDIEPLETMVEAAFQLCHRPATELSGQIARSIPLLKALGVTTRGLDGVTPLAGFDFS
ncbi:SDR family NAD(P)-dependent oxidoreductase [Chakrabartia godavariana]|nr:SDR family NAD(P)-dependent oxidoreductase [Chakrabartia godavariana]